MKDAVSHGQIEGWRSVPTCDQDTELADAFHKASLGQTGYGCLNLTSPPTWQILLHIVILLRVLTPRRARQPLTLANCSPNMSQVIPRYPKLISLLFHEHSVTLCVQWQWTCKTVARALRPTEIKSLSNFVENHGVQVDRRFSAGRAVLFPQVPRAFHNGSASWLQVEQQRLSRDLESLLDSRILSVHLSPPPRIDHFALSLSGNG